MKREKKVKPVRAWVLVARNGWIYRSTARMTREGAESARRHDLMADAVPIEVEIRPALKRRKSRRRSREA